MQLALVLMVPHQPSFGEYQVFPLLTPFKLPSWLPLALQGGCLSWHPYLVIPYLVILKEVVGFRLCPRFLPKVFFFFLDFSPI